MPIDTAQKRASALHFGLPFPDGTVEQGDRQQILWQYAGILAIPLLPAVGYGRVILMERKNPLVLMERK